MIGCSRQARVWRLNIFNASASGSVVDGIGEIMVNSLFTVQKDDDERLMMN
jgi:hypothetical protein